MPVTDISRFLPEIILCATAIIILLTDCFVPTANRVRAAVIAAVGLLAAGGVAIGLWHVGPVTEFWNSYVVDQYAVFFKLFFIITGLAVIALSVDYVRTVHAHGEFFALLVFVVLGMCLLAGALDLLVIYLAFELISLLSYVLVGYSRRDKKSNEAALKYFIYGASASAVMLYGMTLLYGLGGSTNLLALADGLARGTDSPLSGMALIMVLAGLGYKISMAPFQAWAPDVYEGAPTPVTAFLSVGPKAAGFALLIRFVGTAAPSLITQWPMILAVLAVLTMFVGNLLAIRQTNVKRLLAYSSIAHAGYLLIGVVAGGTRLGWGTQGVLFYLVAYLLMNLGAFAVLMIVARNRGSEEISAFKGLGQDAPVYAAAMLVFLLSLTGIPPTAGFLGKFYIFAAAIHSGQWWWLAVVGIINSAISLYYYMNIVRVMYFGGTKGALTFRQTAVGAVVGISFVLTVVLCLYPLPLLHLVRQAGVLIAGI